MLSGYDHGCDGMGREPSPPPVNGGGTVEGGPARAQVSTVRGDEGAQKAPPFADWIQAASAWGYCKHTRQHSEENGFERGGGRTCQTMTPAFQPLALACFTHVPSVAGLMKPLDASAAVAGLPMTSLSSGMPFLGISNSDVPGNAPPELVSSPAQSPYRPWL